MRVVQFVTFGAGGYDSAALDENIIEVRDIEVPHATSAEERLMALSDAIDALTDQSSVATVIAALRAALA
jgi:hypothetical protein